MEAPGPGGEHPHRDWGALDVDGAACSRCGARFRLQDDYVDPTNQGGPVSAENLDPTCPTCHDEKTKEDCEAGLLGLEGEAKRKREGWGPP